jgi:hypothetical protein
LNNLKQYQVESKTLCYFYIKNVRHMCFTIQKHIKTHVFLLSGVRCKAKSHQNGYWHAVWQTSWVINIKKEIKILFYTWFREDHSETFKYICFCPKHSFKSSISFSSGTLYFSTNNRVVRHVKNKRSRGQYTEMLLLDMEKAFDSVCTTVILLCIVICIWVKIILNEKYL